MTVARFIVARNPNERSRLPFLICLPLADGPLWLKTASAWPRVARAYCHPVDEVPEPLQILEEADVVCCERRGVAIDLVLARGLNRRSQFVFTRGRGRPIILWQTARTAIAARPGLRIPYRHDSAPGLIIYADSRERSGYRFAPHHAVVERRSLTVGDYAIYAGETLLAAVERKQLADFATSLVDGRLNFVAAELAALPFGSIVVEDSYSNVLRYPHVRRGFLPELLARLTIRYPNIGINFLDSRRGAEEWTYRFLRAAHCERSQPEIDWGDSDNAAP